MSCMEIRNSRWEASAGAIASVGFAIAGLAAVAFIVHKAIVDPQARWAGEAVTAPLLVSLFLGGLGLIVSVLATAGTVYFARRFLATANGLRQLSGLNIGQRLNHFPVV